MNSHTSKKDLIQSVKELKQGSAITQEMSRNLEEILKESQIRDRELKAVMKGAKAVLQQKSFPDTARSSIVYNLVKQTFKGTISCDSVIHKGAVFTITLPLFSGDDS